VCDDDAIAAQIFVKDTSERMTMDEIRNHPWVVGEYGTPPLRLEPTGPVHQLNATDSKVHTTNACLPTRNANAMGTSPCPAWFAL
jgi:hypothetical protein